MSKKKEPTTAKNIAKKVLRIGLNVLFARENPKAFLQDVMKKRNEEKK